MDENILKKAKEAFDKLSEKAKGMVNDTDGLNKLLNSAKTKMEAMQLDEGLKSLPVIFAMLKSYVKGEYKELPITTIIALIVALLYFVNPNDIIHDKIPILGMIDDAAVIMFCLKVTSSDVEKYKKWIADKGEVIDNASTL